MKLAKSTPTYCHFRWIYGDEAVVDSIRQSTFVAVLLAAERFGIQDLVSRFVGLAEQLLAVTGSFFYEIFDMLDVPTSSPKRTSFYRLCV